MMFYTFQFCTLILFIIWKEHLPFINIDDNVSFSFGKTEKKLISGTSQKSRTRVEEFKLI